MKRVLARVTSIMALSVACVALSATPAGPGPAAAATPAPGARGGAAREGCGNPDRAQMLKKLGIENTRPGKVNNATDPNSVNYDESKANPYPKLPDPSDLRVMRG